MVAMTSLSEKVCNEPFEDIPAHYSKNLQALIDCMLKKEPEERPRIFEIVNFPLIKKTTQEILFDKEFRNEFALMHHFEQ